MAQVKCIRDCYVKGMLYRMGRIYEISIKDPWAKFFDFPTGAAKDAELQAEAEKLKRENEKLRAGSGQK
jgi:hypothetical protein